MKCQVCYQKLVVVLVLCIYTFLKRLLFEDNSNKLALVKIKIAIHSLERKISLLKRLVPSHPIIMTNVYDAYEFKSIFCSKTLE